MLLTVRYLRSIFPNLPRISRAMQTRSDFQSNAKELVEEVQIKVPWGYLAGKWWGPKHVRPIVGLHGWQDNAGTFDTLAPLLPKHLGLLCIDLPGHGLSSRIPDGMFYNSIDNLQVILTVMKEYNWNKISLMGHSMSSIIGFVFAALFPDKVDLLIGLDALKPHIRPVPSIVKTQKKRFQNFMISDQRNQAKEEPPSYPYEECIEKLHIGGFKSIDRDKCFHLLNRNIAKSTKYPDKYFFTRDSRLKCYNYGTNFQDLNFEYARKIRAPYLFIKASDSSFFEEEKYFHEIIDVLKNNSDFQFHTVKGTHHVHLNDPTRVSDIISEFINKYKPNSQNLSKL